MNPGRELDALIAKKLFNNTYIWTVDHQHFTKDQWCIAETRAVSRDAAILDYEHEAYSTDIAAAWLVVEKLTEYLHKEGGSGEPEYIQIMPPIDEKQGWVVRHMWMHHDGDILINFVTGKTAPHAICLAALKAIERD